MLKRILFLCLSIVSNALVTTKTVTVTVTRECLPTNIPKPPSSYTLKCLKLINDFRKLHNVPPLKPYYAKKQCSVKQAFADYKSSFHKNFGMCDENAQCECKGFKTLKECIDVYISEGKGGGHFEIIRSKKYTHLACGEYEYSPNTYFHVQNLFTIQPESNPTSNTPAPPPVPTMPTVESDNCVALINKFRQNQGLSKLRPALDSQNQCANGAAQNDKSRGFHNSFGKCYERAQCECNGQSTVGQCIDAYISEGPGGGHYEILRGPYTSVACGTDGSRFYTHNFY